MIKLTASQSAHLLAIVEDGQVVECFNGRRSWKMSRPGMRVAVLKKLVKLGLATVEGETSPNGATITRWTATEAGRAMVVAS